MKVYQTNEIRNIAIIGGNRVGKTTLAETIAFHGGVISRRGTVDDKNTSDYEKSNPIDNNLLTSVMYAQHNGIKIKYRRNLDDFIAHCLYALWIRLCGIIPKWC